jgi:hypothetical protein
VELSRWRPDRAIEQLGIAAPYERGFVAALGPIHLRGQAYLMQRQGAQAALEFQRIFDHRGTDPFSPLYALAPLGLARARALSGDTAGSRTAYEQFLTQWADADADIPVVQEARREFARLARLERTTGGARGGKSH